jgi:UDP-N-acetyl-D-mannosaminuronate dehydrogenase
MKAGKRTKELFVVTRGTIFVYEGHRKHIHTKERGDVLDVYAILQDNQHQYNFMVTTDQCHGYWLDLSLLKNACRLVGKNINKNAIVIFESTVYPGVTEKICGPILAKESSFKLNNTFYLGYSPERINSGDKKNTLTKIDKIIAFKIKNKEAKNKISKPISKFNFRFKSAIYNKK